MLRLCFPALCLLVLSGFVCSLQAKPQPLLEHNEASRLARLVLNNIEREYPNHPDHVLNGPEDLASPKTLHPAFYGCYDWHSSVHGHWLLIKLLREFPELEEASEIRRVMDAHLNRSAISVERAYLRLPNRSAFGQTYGWAWLLKLNAELQTWDDADASRWWLALCPLANDFVARAKSQLARQDYPHRSGLHSSTAFSLSLYLDYAEAVNDREFSELIKKRAWDFYSADQDAPLRWEPNGGDFLSPSLEEAALMVRVLPAVDAKVWLAKYLPSLTEGELLSPVKVSDRGNAHIVHLDGLNLSRARCLYRLAQFYGRNEPLGRHFATSAEEHLAVSLPYVISGNYEGEHWLGTFALLSVLSKRGP